MTYLVVLFFMVELARGCLLYDDLHLNITEIAI